MRKILCPQRPLKQAWWQARRALKRRTHTLLEGNAIWLLQVSKYAKRYASVAVFDKPRYCGSQDQKRTKRWGIAALNFYILHGCVMTMTRSRAWRASTVRPHFTAHKSGRRPEKNHYKWLGSRRHLGYIDHHLAKAMQDVADSQVSALFFLWNLFRHLLTWWSFPRFHMYPSKGSWDRKECKYLHCFLFLYPGRRGLCYLSLRGHFASKPRKVPSGLIIARFLVWCCLVGCSFLFLLYIFHLFAASSSSTSVWCCFSRDNNSSACLSALSGNSFDMCQLR